MKVLLVDDSKSARYALRLQLQRHSMSVETADAAESALERVREAPPDAIFMDHTMPGMNGFEALDVLKSSPETAHIPVVMCTSNEDPEFIAQARKKGAFDILSKSTAPEKLKGLLDRLQIEAVPTEVSGPTVAVGDNVPRNRATAEGVPAFSAALNEEQLDARIRGLAESMIVDRTEILAQDLIARIDERIQAGVRSSIMPMMDDLAQRLSRDLITKTDERLVSGLNMQSERLQEHFQKIQSEQTNLTTEHLRSDVLPQLIRQQLERDKQDLSQTVRKHIDASMNKLVKEPSFLRHVFDTVEATVAGNAVQVAKRRATEIAETVASERANAITELLGETSKSRESPMYLLSAGAAFIGIAAAAVVFFLLR